MAKPKKENNEAADFKAPEIVPNGAHFGIVQFPQDLKPPPSAQRIVQWVNRNGTLSVYISENAYHRHEAFAWMDKLFRDSYRESIAKGATALTPIKGRIHWCRFTEEFCIKLKGERINPETDLPEVVA